MEDDRYQQNSKLFITGLICLLFSLSLCAMGLYVLPYLLFGWNYSVPGFVITFREWLKESYAYSDFGSAMVTFLSFLVPGLICGFISYYASNHIDNQIFGIQPEKKESSVDMKKEVKESLGFGLQLFLLIVLVIIAVFAVQWLVAPPVRTV
ncbi:MAG: hypothetical protein LCH30_09810 [Proteobacteria bacterium]|nr:hypothetical protein [Pseudomonadota bacterium]